MTPSAAAPGEGAATIDRLACRIRPPRDGIDDGALSSRLEQVLGGRLAGSLGSALGALDGFDEGAVWVVRSMHAQVVVSSTLEDLDRLSDQWAGQLAAAILGVIRAGPGGNVVRFASRAEYLAEFAVALALGRADAWMFGPLAGLRLLAPAAAIRTGAAGAGVPVAEVIAALIASRRLETVLAAMTELEANRLWAVCAEEAAAVGAPRRGLAELLRALAAQELAGELVTGEPGLLGLRLLAVAAAQLGTGPEVVTAIAAVAGGGDFASLLRPARAQREVPPSIAPPSLAANAPPSGPELPDHRPRGGRRREATTESRVFAAAGAPAFLLLPSLERLGLADQPAAARTSVLARALRCHSDDALRLATGELEACDVVDPRPLLGSVLRALAQDERIDSRRWRCDIGQHPHGRCRVAIVRDVATDLWLAGTVLARRDAPDWAALVGGVSADTGLVPETIVGPGSADEVPERRPVDADLAWLTPGDDTELAIALAARAVTRDLARRLMGFANSSMSYLAGRFLPPGGIVTATPERIHAELPAAPLAVILVMAGLDRLTYHVPWLEPEVLVTHRIG